MPKIYVVTLDYFYSDYKRPEAYSKVIDVLFDELEAYKLMLRHEFQANIDHSTSDEGHAKYEELSKKIDDLTLETLDDFIDKFEEARNESLGEPEFGVLPTGSKGFVANFEKDFVQVNDPKSEIIS